MKRCAILIANSKYSDRHFHDLFAPVDEARVLRDLLKHPDVGAFDHVELIENESKSGVERALEKLVRAARSDDLILIYFSGHGELSSSGRLYLAVSNSEAGLLHSTAVSATWIKELLHECAGASKVLLLDCCYGGAFVDRQHKSIATVDVGDQLDAGQGKYILTATNAVQRAKDGTPADGESEGTYSTFTAAIIDGLSTGLADISGLGKITPDDLGRYVRFEVTKRTTAQNPWVYGSVHEDVFLAWARAGIHRRQTADRKIYLGDLLGDIAVVDGIGMRAQEWRQHDGLVVPVGQSYRPGLPPGDPVTIDLCGEAVNLLILGKQRSGKSTLLRTLIVAAALTRSPEEVLFYCLESGANRLGSMMGLRHIRGVVTDDHPQAVREMLTEIKALIQSRKQLLRQRNVDSFKALRTKAGILPELPHPDVFLIIDRWHDFAEVKGLREAVLQIADGGHEYGVHVIV